jgi:hypothetical protein
MHMDARARRRPVGLILRFEPAQASVPELALKGPQPSLECVTEFVCPNQATLRLVVGIGRKGREEVEAVFGDLYGELDGVWGVISELESGYGGRRRGGGDVAVVGRVCGGVESGDLSFDL